MTPPFEMIIIGGGCAGLSLAMRLSNVLEKKACHVHGQPAPLE
jgi:protoporphyrinogen oxidase